MPGGPAAPVPCAPVPWSLLSRSNHVCDPNPTTREPTISTGWSRFSTPGGLANIETSGLLGNRSADRHRRVRRRRRPSIAGSGQVGAVDPSVADIGTGAGDRDIQRGECGCDRARHCPRRPIQHPIPHPGVSRGLCGIRGRPIAGTGRVGVGHGRTHERAVRIHALAKQPDSDRGVQLDREVLVWPIRRPQRGRRVVHLSRSCGIRRRIGAVARDGAGSLEDRASVRSVRQRRRRGEHGNQRVIRAGGSQVRAGAGSRERGAGLPSHLRGRGAGPAPCPLLPAPALYFSRQQ